MYICWKIAHLSFPPSRISILSFWGIENLCHICAILFSTSVLMLTTNISNATQYLQIVFLNFDGKDFLTQLLITNYFDTILPIIDQLPTPVYVG